MRLLFVCTGNLCRSPVAGRLTAALARRSELAEEVAVTSAGLAAPAGQPVHPLSAAALVRLGGDPAGFRLAAVRRRAGDRRRPGAHPDPGAAARRAGADPAGAAPHLHAARGRRPPPPRRPDRSARPVPRRPRGRAGPAAGRRAGAARLDPADDIADPVGGQAAVHRATAEQIAAALALLAGVLFEPSSVSPADVATVPAA